MIDAKKEIIDCWDKSSATYDSHYGHGIKSADEASAWKKALEDIVGTESLNILDIGTGTGFLAIILADMGHRVKGIDLSEGMMEKARTKADKSGLSIAFEIEDAEKLLSEPDEYYDIVINRHLLWTLLSPEKALREWNRVLKPGGRVVIIDGNWSNPSRGKKLRVNLGNLLIVVTEFRNPWKKKGSYSEELSEMLPMRKKENCGKAAKIVENCGFRNVRQYYLDEIDWTERKAMPLKRRLTTTYRRHVITGIKP
ncbi:MAG: class I SAM-dependent methyltransferase [Clostridiales bacterium]|jgi:ubiquinone/menaquinone biosynthesis C-methylase UbiE|nr:class I SAM-dependent methyltransferase [Clostridiales bacterium]